MVCLLKQAYSIAMEQGPAPGVPKGSIGRLNLLKPGGPCVLQEVRRSALCTDSADLRSRQTQRRKHHTNLERLMLPLFVFIFKITA